MYKLPAKTSTKQDYVILACFPQLLEEGVDDWTENKGRGFLSCSCSDKTLRQSSPIVFFKFVVTACLAASTVSAMFFKDIAKIDKNQYYEEPVRPLNI